MINNFLVYWIEIDYTSTPINYLKAVKKIYSCM
jgi:hypothetical protein